MLRGTAEEEGEMYFPFASAPILYVTPCNVTEHGRDGVLRHSFIMCLPVGQDVFNLLLCAALAV